MNIQSLGHVVLKVRNQARAEAFYNGILGLTSLNKGLELLTCCRVGVAAHPAVC